MSLEPPNNPGTGGVAYEAIKDVKRLTFSPVLWAIGQLTTGAAGRREGGQETWLLVWALSLPAHVTLGKILDFSLLQVSHVQIENHEAHCTNPWSH